MRWWLTAVAGCTWISPAEHEKNQLGLEADADADADADTDADADADTDADTDPVCVDDAEEEDDGQLTANAAVPPYTHDGVLCPEDEPGDLPVPADLFEVVVDGDDVLVAALGAGATTPCAEMDLVLDVVDHDGNVKTSARGACPEVSSGFGAGTWFVRAYHAEPGAPEQSYALSIDLEECRDGDDDDWLAASCGGLDCDDGVGGIFPGAPEVHGDLVDQDCDGGDDLGFGCQIIAGGFGVSGAGNLPCGDPATDPVWDRWEVTNVAAGTEASVVVQNGMIGVADPIALVVDGSGTAHYGLEADGSQLDDEVTCNETTWDLDLTACPGQCVYVGTTGTLTVWIAQKDGMGCTDDADYDFILKLGGITATAVAVADDVVLAFP